MNSSPENETVTEMVHCILRKFLEVPTFDARCLSVCKNAREPSGKIGSICRRFVM